MDLELGQYKVIQVCQPAKGKGKRISKRNWRVTFLDRMHWIATKIK